MRGDGGYIIVEPSNHKSGDQYPWENLREGAKPAQLPEWLESLLVEEQDEEVAGLTHAEHTSDVLAPQQIQELLSHINGEGRSYWFEVGCALMNLFGKEEGFVLWDEWARDFPGYQGQKDQRYQWASFDKAASKHTAGTLFWLAKEGGWKPSEQFHEWGRVESQQRAKNAVATLTRESSSSDIHRAVALLEPLSAVEKDMLLKEVKRLTKAGIWSLTQ